MNAWGGSFFVKSPEELQDNASRRLLLATSLLECAIEDQEKDPSDEHRENVLDAIEDTLDAKAVWQEWHLV